MFFFVKLLAAELLELTGPYITLVSSYAFYVSTSSQNLCSLTFVLRLKLK